MWRLLSHPLRWVAWWLGALPRWMRRPAEGSWLLVRVGPRLLEEDPQPLPWFRRLLPFGGAATAATSLEGLERVLRAARGDRRLAGVMVSLQPLSAGWGRLWALRRVLGEAKRRGLRIVVHLPLGGGLRELFVASVASETWVEPEAGLSVWGLGLERIYWGGALERLGIRVERFAEGRFKTAGEALATDRMSEGEREQLTALFEDLEGELRVAFGERVALSDPAVLESARAKAVLQGVEAVETGWADAAVHEERVAERLVGFGGAEQDAKRTTSRGEADEAPLLPQRRYDRWVRARRRPRLRSSRAVAVLRLTGLIAEPPGHGGRVGRWLRALREVRESDRYAALLLVVNSPGGGATASDRLRVAIRRVAERKPVAALLTDVAASGGYLAAMGAGRIFAAPTTLTGSIGVVAVLPTLEGLLRRLGLRREALRAGPCAHFLSPWRSVPTEERARFEAFLRAHYERFVEVVAKARGRSIEQVHAVAQGRVWSGRAALRHGLLDELGGMSEALDWLGAEAGIDARAEPLHPVGAAPRGTWPFGADGGQGLGVGSLWSDLQALGGEPALFLEPRGLLGGGWGAWLAAP